METKKFSEGAISSLQNPSLEVHALDPQGSPWVPSLLFEKGSHQHGLFSSLPPADVKWWYLERVKGSQGFANSTTGQQAPRQDGGWMGWNEENKK